MAWDGFDQGSDPVWSVQERFFEMEDDAFRVNLSMPDDMWRPEPDDTHIAAAAQESVPPDDPAWDEAVTWGRHTS